MGIYGIKPKFQRALASVEAWLIKHHVHPDVITLSALVLSIAGGFAIAMSGHAPLLLLLVPFVCIVRTALNALDGMVAKDTGVARPWGEVLNEFTDRIADLSLLGGVALSGYVNGTLAAVTLILMLLGSYIGVLSKAAGGPRQYVGRMGKADRMMLLSVAAVAAIFVNPYWAFGAFLVLVAFGLIVTIGERLRTTYNDLKSVQ